MSCFELAWRVFLALLISGALSASAEVRTVDRVVGARAVQGEIVLDGVLNESDWQGAGRRPSCQGPLHLEQARPRSCPLGAAAVLKLTYLIAV